MSKWSIKGFDALSKGTFENAGQNLYVSKKGGLQRIWRFDVNQDGYVDLCIANSHAFGEHPMTHIIHDPAGEARLQEVLTQGAQHGCVADVNGDGYDDLIIVSQNDGHHADLPAYVYFGGPDGITENRKIDLAGTAAICCGVGDFDGDGKKEICLLVAVAQSHSSQITFGARSLRIYKEAELGFRIDEYKDYPMDVRYFEVADIDGDGCDDLYCKSTNGKWFILWGGKDGFSNANRLDIGQTPDETARFSLLPVGGGNVGSADFARSKVVKLNGRTYLFYADTYRARLIPVVKRVLDTANEIIFNVPNAYSIAVGNIETENDVVILQVMGKDDQHALVFYASKGYETPVKALPVKTPRDVLLYDFSGTGHDDIVVAQGRGETAYTTESVMFTVDANAVIADEPIRYVTHDAMAVAAAKFDDNDKKSLVFINHEESFSYGHVPTYVYLGGKDGFKPDNRLEFPGHSAGTMMPIDFNDDGFTDMLVMQNAEDQPFLEPDNDLYWGGPDGFDLERRSALKAPLAWGGHCADLNRDGYLDVIAVCGRWIHIFYGHEGGYNEEPDVKLDASYGLPEGAKSSALWPALADLNGDGWLDLIAPVSWQNYAIVYWGGENGFSDANTIRLPVERPLTVRVADLNRDGYPDLVFGTRVSTVRNIGQEGTVTIFWGGKDGYSGYNCCVLPSYQSNCITIGDLNNDGWLDIFASSYFNSRERDVNSYIYWNDHGKFSLTNRKRMFAHSSSASWIADFNEDGYMDVCLTNHRAYGNHITESAIWYNGPEGFKEDNRTWLPTLGPHDMVPNDIGNVMTRAPEEYYIAPAAVVDAPKTIGWNGTTPVKTWVNCQIRTADSEATLADAAFVGPDGTADSRFTCGQEIPAGLIHGKYVQVKLFLGAVNSGNSPRIEEIYID